MNFTIEQDERATIFRPKESRLDSLVASELKAEFLILAQTDVEKLIIDLTDVEYIDSAGLSALLLARRQQAAHDGDVRLVGASEDVISLLELTQLDRALPVYGSVQEALRAPSLSMSTVAPDGIKSVATMAAVELANSIFAYAPYDLALGDDEEVDYDEDEDEDDDLLEIEEEYEGEDEEEDEDEVEPGGDDQDVVEEEDEEEDEEDIELDDDDFDDDYDDEDEDEDEEESLI